MAGEGRALLVLCGLCACAAGSAPGPGAGAGAAYCRQLEELRLESGAGGAIPARALSERGSARVLALSARGAAPEAARALLHALLRHALRYRPGDLVLVNYSLAELQAVDKQTHAEEFILSMSTEWRGEGARREQCLAGACDVAGARLAVLGPGAAPARRLLARVAPRAPAGCRDHWRRLLAPECGFRADTALHDATALCSEWPNSTCPDGTACVVVAVDPGDEEQCRLARELAATVPVRLAPSTELRGNRSLLFFDYMWSDRPEHAWLAPPRPCGGAGDACPPAPEPVSLALGDVHKLTRYAPPVLNLALRFRPPAALLRRVLANSPVLGLQGAACEALVDNTTRELARDWITCDDYFCDQKPTIRIYVCEEAQEYYQNVSNIVYGYWLSSTNRSSGLAPGLFRTACSKPDEVNWDLNVAMSEYEAYARLRGVVAMGAAAASALPEIAMRARVPLLLAAAPAGGVALPAGARGSAPGAPALTAAVRALLQRCGWRRVALLREEGSCDIWKRSLGVAEGLRAQAELVVHTELVSAENASAALGALRAQDARVVLVDTSAGTAARVLRAAERDPRPRADVVWIVVGQASSDDDPSQDWLPTTPELSYVTVGAWRGGGGGADSARLRGALGAGSARLRGALDATLGAAWRAHAAPLADALLMMFEGVARLHVARPHLRDDPHQPNAQQLFYEELDNITLEGVTHNIRANESIPVFAYRWTASGPQLVFAWGARGPAPALAGALCGAADGPACHTTRSGPEFTPHCHDVAWAVLLCALALGLPALGAARAARRRRLRRRDRAVEERALLRGGHSAAEAAAGAALAEHAVPRAALRLLERLGAGHSGVVHQAVLRRPAAAALAVAAKASRADAPAGAAAELLREAALLAALRHEHIVRFAGVCWEGGPLVLMEHAFHGDLRRYLRARRTLAERARAGLPEPEAAHVAAPALTRLAREAAAALGYLARRRLVHRDVRAANCLVDSRRRLKLADFGMARWLDRAGAGDDEYVCRRRAMFPVLWMAPESLARGVFSAASDVWALGVLLLELATLGERPFGTWRAARVLRHVRAGGTPPLPSDAAPSTRGVTEACWRFAAEERPSATELVAYLAEHPRAVQPALQPHADADADADSGLAAADTDLYIDEWTDD